jgi:hypothetical protein
VPGNTSRQRIAPSNDPGADKTKKTQCERADRAIQSWSNFQQGYDAELPDAKKNDWSHDEYDQAVQAYANAHAGPGGAGGSGATAIAASTNMCTCQTTGLDDWCKYLKSIGAPQALCDASAAHEQAHHDQCEANKSANPPLWQCDGDHVRDMTPDQIDHDEHEAYDKALDIARKWYDANCR